MKLRKLLLASILCAGISSQSLAQAELQIIHNCADPAAAEVDIYVNGTITLDDFKFREATGFLPVPSGVQLNIGIAPGNSLSANDTLVNIPVTLMANEKYAAIASGVLNPGSFAANPNSVATGFQLLLTAGMRTSALNAGEVDFRVLHGATDAPAVDVAAQGVATLVTNAAYTDLTGYISVPAADYILDIIPSGTSTPLISYAAPLSGLAGGSAVVFASGFLDPSQNQNGAGFGLFAALANGTVLPLNVFGSARLQVIHNAADPAAALVDVYLNGTILLNDFAFRTATPFIDAPAGVIQNIGIAPSTSTSANDTLVNIPVLLNDGETYVAVANGVLNPANFAANPEGVSTAFQLLLFNGMQESAVNAGNVDLAILHGATDAPAVDIYARGVAQLVDSAAYTNLAGYLPVPAADYLIDITPAAGSPILVTYSAPLSGLAGGAAVVFASGFLDPSQNQSGAAFGVLAALPDGTVLELNDTSLARLQVIHNCADPAADSVDVYVNGGIALDNFAFRTATPYIDVPAGVTLSVGIAGKNSATVNDTLVNFDVTLNNGETYVAIASGVLSPASFSANPDGRPTGFTLLLQNEMREVSTDPANVEFRVLHGATDAPTVDVLVSGGGTLVNDAAYTDITGYLGVPASDYILNITPGNDNSIIVASYFAPLSGLAGGAATVFASGFLDPSSNQNGAAFGLFAALPDGTVLELGDTSAARLQVIHNCADPAADSVDVYVNGSLTLDNFAFRTATPYISVPAGVTLSIGIAGKNSTSVNDTLVNFDVTLNNGETYLAIASGVLSPASFAANPDGRPTGFTLLLQNEMREFSSDPANVEFRVIHGSTDAPTVDVLVAGGGTIVDDAAYTDITGYLGVPAANYTLNITPGNNNSVIVASFIAPLNGLAGGTASVFASGFLNPAANQNGPAFGLYAALANGQVVAFPIATGLGENQVNGIDNIYPNPANDQLQVRLNENMKAEALHITDVTGKVVKVQNIANYSNGFEVNLNGLEQGTYFLHLFDGEKVSNRMFQIVR